MAEKILSGAAADPAKLRIVGQIDYRAGRFAEAIERLNQAVKLYDSNPKLQTSGDADGFFSVDGPFLVMAHHRLGHADERDARLLKSKSEAPASPSCWRKMPRTRGTAGITACQPGWCAPRPRH